jgi:hypothetical protein
MPSGKAGVKEVKLLMITGAYPSNFGKKRLLKKILGINSKTKPSKKLSGLNPLKLRLINSASNLKT